MRNEARYLARTVPTMLEQRLDGPGEIELLFAEGGSDDDSRTILERFARRDHRVRVLDSPTGRIPDGLNIGLAHARGEFVARMDAHCFYPPRYLADGIERLRRGDVDWVAGPAVPRAVGGASGAIALALGSPLGQGPSRRMVSSGALGASERELDTGVFAGVWRHATLGRLGGWDARWSRNEDSELAARHLARGGRIVSLPTMAAEYIPRRTLRALFAQYHANGCYRAHTFMRHPLSRRRSHAFPLGLVAALALAPAPGPARRPARAALAAYSTALAVETARVAVSVQAPARDLARLPAAFLTMHLAFGLGLLRGLMEVVPSRLAGSQTFEKRNT